MRCASCGTENRLSAKFCASCGSALARSCASCGAVAPASASYCDECGSALTDAGIGGPVAPGASVPASGDPFPGPVSERRLCSVLFADLVDFTSLSESRDPEEVRELLSHYFDVARRTVTRYGGIVEKFIGDAVMAVWGTPAAQEGDTERAVRAALELVDAMEALGTQVGSSGLSARAGVVTGEVAVTIGASGEGMVAGDAVNTASRVQSVARPSSVFVDEVTKKLTERAISFEAVGTHELKGKEHPERLFRAIRVVSGMGGKQRADGLEAPFTGRDAELRALKDFFHASVERRAPRLVVVSGPAGVGKSRLGWEFEKYLDGIADTVLWHRGRCLSYGEGVAFWALAEIVRQRFGIGEEELTEVASAKLQEGLVRFVTDEAERDYVGVRFSRLLGVPYPSETRTVLSQEELYAGWRLFFERLAQVAPVVMLVEDAQHADESLLGFVEHLIDWTRELSIFVVLFARPGLPAIDSGYGMGRNRSTVSLDPLDDPSMATLVESLVPGMPPVSRDTITARAQGIPLFAVETVRSLVDQGIVQIDGDAHHLVGDLGELTIPDSLHALLAGRLDALPPEVRALAADASVLGTSFPKDALIAVSGRDEAHVQAALSELVKRDVLQIFADPLSPERGAYSFSQEMLRQVAYETLSKRDRKARHLAAAAHLRATFANDGEEIANVIARHYLDALSVGPHDTDTGKITAQSLDFLVRAAERAERSGAPARAAESYAQAAAISAVDQAAALFEKASQASIAYGDYETAIVHADSAYERHLGLGGGRGSARSQILKGQALLRLGRFGAAREQITEALQALEQVPDVDTVKALIGLANLHTFGGEPDEGERLAAKALILGQDLDVGAAELASAFIARGTAVSMQNRSVESISNYETAVRLAERAGDSRALGVAQIDLAVSLRNRDPTGAAEASRAAADVARRTGQREMLGYAAVNLAASLVELGQWDDAQAALEQALVEDHVETGFAHCFLGYLAGLRGDGTRAATALDPVPAWRESDEVQVRAAIEVLDALTSICVGNLNGAIAHAMSALERRDAIGIGADYPRLAWPLAARAAHTLGRTDVLTELLAMLDSHPVGHLPPILQEERRLVAGLLSAAAGAPDAISLMRDAVAGLREIGNPYELAHALIDYAGVLAKFGEHGGVDCLAEARQIGDRLQCAPLLMRADSQTTSPRTHSAT